MSLIKVEIAKSVWNGYELQVVVKGADGEDVVLRQVIPEEHLLRGVAPFALEAFSQAILLELEQRQKGTAKSVLAALLSAAEADRGETA